MAFFAYPFTPSARLVRSGLLVALVLGVGCGSRTELSGPRTDAGVAEDAGPNEDGAADALQVDGAKDSGCVAETPDCGGLCGTVVDNCGTPFDCGGCNVGQSCVAGTCQCDPASCAGCCAGALCVAGNDNNACGSGGEVCVSCSGSCVNGACAGVKAVLFGGLTDSMVQHGDTWIFDGSGWSEVAGPGPSQRAFHAMTTLGNTIVLFGGRAVYSPTSALNDTWLFDGKTWTPVSGPAPAKRFGHALATLGKNVVLFGGWDSNKNELGDTWVFDGSSWTEVPTAGPSPRVYHAMAALPDRLVLFGGTAGSALGDTWTFDGQAWAKVGGAAPSARYHHAMTSWQGGVLLHGAPNDTWWFKGKWTAAATGGPSDRHLHAMTSVENQAVLFGGYGPGVGKLGDTWIFQAGQWKHLNVAGPPPRWAHTLAALP